MNAHCRILLVLFVLLLPINCEAIDVKVSGEWQFGGGWAKNAGSPAFYRAENGGAGEDIFFYQQRLRTQFEFIASESLKAVLQIQVGPTVWGRGVQGDTGLGAGGGVDADGVNLATRRAYVDWFVPDTQVSIRMGIQGLSLPSATFGSPVLYTEAAGMTASVPLTESVTATAFWIRPFDLAATDFDGRRMDESDLFGLFLPLSTRGFSLTPWVMGGLIGGESGYFAYRFGEDPANTDYAFHGSSTALWTGAAIEIPLAAPWTLGVDALYGQVRGRHDARNQDAPFAHTPKYRGWLASALLEYKTGTAWGIPGLLGWYASGDGKNATHSAEFGRMPVLGTNDSGFVATRFGYPGTTGVGSDSILGRSGVGVWGVGARLKDFSFVKNLTHFLQATYVRGTNHPDMVRQGRIGLGGGGMDDHTYLTSRDSAVELDFFSTYDIFSNLQMYVETAWIRLKRSADVWQGNEARTSDAWKAQLLFQFNF